MKRLMAEEQFQFLRNRNCIENVWSVLRKNYNLIYHAARSIPGMFRHFFYSITAFLLHWGGDTEHILVVPFDKTLKLEF